MRFLFNLGISAFYTCWVVSLWSSSFIYRLHFEDLTSSSRSSSSISFSANPRRTIRIRQVGFVVFVFFPLSDRCFHFKMTFFSPSIYKWNVKHFVRTVCNQDLYTNNFSSPICFGYANCGQRKWIREPTRCSPFSIFRLVLHIRT